MPVRYEIVGANLVVKTIVAVPDLLPLGPASPVADAKIRMMLLRAQTELGLAVVSHGRTDADFDGEATRFATGLAVRMASRPTMGS